MKKNITIIGLLSVLVAGLITVAKVPAQGNPRDQVHSVVVIQARGTYYRAPNNELIQTGLEVEWAEADPSAPKIEIGAKLADTIAYLMNQGYAFELLPARGYVLTK